MLKKLEKWLIRVNQILLGLMMLIMFILVFGNVISRYVFSYSLNWAEELSRYLMIWTTFLGAGLAMREGRHVAIEFLHGYLPERTIRPYFRAFVGLIILGFMGILAYLGYQYSILSTDASPVLRWPIGMVYMVIPVGSVLFILHLITIFRDYMKQSSIEEFSDVEIDKELLDRERGTHV